MVADALDKRYQEGRWVSGLPEIFEMPKIILDPKKTALFIVDMQKAVCLPDADVGVLKILKEVAPEDFDYYMDRLRTTVVPNLRKLQAFFRRNNLEVVQCLICSLTKDGRDRLPHDKTMGLHFPLNSKQAQIIDELKPKPDEIVFTKTTSGIFTPYINVYHVFTSMGIEHMIFGGCVTDGCVQNTVIGAMDLFGKNTNVLVEDCCATFNEEHHVSAIKIMKCSCAAGIGSAENVINHLTEQLEASRVNVK